MEVQERFLKGKSRIDYKGGLNHDKYFKKLKQENQNEI